MPKLSPQELRTFFLSSSCFQRKKLFQVDRMASLMQDVLFQNHKQSRFLLHSFVIMPDHLHVLLTPSAEVSLEKAVMYIKGGFSFRAKKELAYNWNIWQRTYNEHRIKDAQDYWSHLEYIHENPVRAGIVLDAKEYRWSSVKMLLDPMLAHFQA